MQVQAIEERTGNTAAIAAYLIGGAVAAIGRVAVIAAWARVHRGDQQEARRKFHLPGRARDRDGAGFERFAQHLEHVPFEFRQFIEK